MILTRRTKNLKHLVNCIKAVEDDKVRKDLIEAFMAIDVAYNKAEKELAGYYTL